MSKPRNKTLIKVGDVVYHPHLGTYPVAELTPLSNRVIYVVLQNDASGKDKEECAAFNSATMRTLKPLDYWMTTPFFIDPLECDRERERLNDWDRWKEIGYRVIQVWKGLKKL